MPDKQLPPAELHPEDDRAFATLSDRLAADVERLDVDALALRGLAASLDRHGDLERYAPVIRVAERLEHAAAQLAAGVQLLALAWDLEHPVPVPDPDELIEAPERPQPVEPERPTEQHGRPQREGAERAAERPQLPTEGERLAGPYVTRSAAAQAPATAADLGRC